MDTKCGIRWFAVALLGLLPLWALPAHAEEYGGDDPPTRAARLTALSGNVGLRAAGDSGWSDAEENRPLTSGDALDLAPGARAEIDFGGAQVRLDGDTQAYLDRLDDHVARVDVRSGTASLDVDDNRAGVAYEMRTPTIAFAPNGDGAFRVDVDASGVTTLTLFEGEGTVYGRNGAHYDVRPNQSYRFQDPELRDVVGLPRPERDGFDRWVAERESGYGQGVAQQYVDPGVVGAADLDAYGHWESADDYGPIWYPTRVVVEDWAPYRYGRWRYVRPWGWTWIDDAPWGYAPFHYGRWAYVRNRWGWVPGPRYVRPVYSPALVGFVGGPSLFLSIHSGPPVGWFPLGPRDVYCPPYRHSRNYFTRVNVTNVTVVNHTVINRVYEDVHVHKRPNRVNYTYRNNHRATTVASRDDFQRGRRLGNNRLRVSDEQLSRAELTTNLAPQRDDRPDRSDRSPRNDRPATNDRPRPDRGNFGNAQGAQGGNAPAANVQGRPAPGRNAPGGAATVGNDRGNDRPGRSSPNRRDGDAAQPVSRPTNAAGLRYEPRSGSPSRAPGRANPSAGQPFDDASRTPDRRMWSTPDDGVVRYRAPDSQPSRAYRVEPLPRSSPSPDRGAPRAMDSRPSTPPPGMGPGGVRNHPPGRGNEVPPRGDHRGGRANAGERQGRSPDGSSRNAGTRN